MCMCECVLELGTYEFKFYVYRNNDCWQAYYTTTDHMKIELNYCSV